MNHIIHIEGEPNTLTTDHPSSSYGIPVLIGEDNIARGPEDTCNLLISAATDEALAALRRAGFEFTDARETY